MSQLRNPQANSPELTEFLPSYAYFHSFMNQIKLWINETELQLQSSPTPQIFHNPILLTPFIPSIPIPIFYFSYKFPRKMGW